MVLANYLLLALLLTSFFLTLYRFVKFLASFQSLLSAVLQAGRDTPKSYLLTGGFLSLVSVFRHAENAHDRKRLVRLRLVS
jgi:uncharacterized membrane protein (DUF485 family)